MICTIKFVIQRLRNEFKVGGAEGAPRFKVGGAEGAPRFKVGGAEGAPPQSWGAEGAPPLTT